MEIEESWSDDWSDDEVPDEDYYEDDSTETVPCPACGEDVYEEAEQCPNCGEYITHSGSDYLWRNRPIWWIVLGTAGILAMLYTLVFQWL